MGGGGTRAGTAGRPLLFSLPSLDKIREGVFVSELPPGHLNQKTERKNPLKIGTAEIKPPSNPARYPCKKKKKSRESVLLLFYSKFYVQIPAEATGLGLPNPARDQLATANELSSSSHGSG